MNVGTTPSSACSSSFCFCFFFLPMLLNCKWTQRRLGCHLPDFSSLVVELQLQSLLWLCAKCFYSSMCCWYGWADRGPLFCCLIPLSAYVCSGGEGWLHLPFAWTCLERNLEKNSALWFSPDYLVGLCLLFKGTFK